MESIDVLDLEYSSRGRDIDIVEPTLSYLELRYGYKIKRKWLYSNYVLDIFRIRPKVLIIANGVGDLEHFCAVKFASLLGIKVVTFISEGDYLSADQSIQNFFWGWNSDRYCYEDLHLEWSQRNIDFIKEHIPYEARANVDIKLSGATGFDKYKLLSFEDKYIFLHKYKLEQYSKVVGIAGWGFDHFYGDYFEKFKEIYYEKEYNSIEIENFRQSLEEVRKGYEFIIKNSPDILFILKCHPMLVNDTYSEFFELNKYPNVLELHTEENIYDIINVSDIWLAFESTTCLEAWLLNKTTLLYNPLMSDFRRSIIHKGSFIVKEKEELLGLIRLFFENGVIDEFVQLESERKRIIKEVIGFEDGCSFIRAAQYIKELLDDAKEKKMRNVLSFVPIFVRKWLKNIVIKNSIFAYIPIIKNKRMKSLAFLSGMYTDAERQHYVDLYKSAIHEKYFL
ncbi:BFO_1060 family glycosyltransferase [Bacteroides oleiciplenus]|uniref:CDP-glycerol--glycerophosphate glycerophosphotransferase n=1 Tax=Bacteroides oleiciplenus TaxID=626931 RepID=A0A3E5B7B2_9BACE|nr:hypothetical protein [Bacteroides oleiciplenus]RGN33235.1 hypothetical protein DXB65_15990 [Bacteroides oleiciplenus]